MLTLRNATESDLDLLAELNRQLIVDEGHANPMTVEQLRARMRAWLASEYRAALFDAQSVVGYALFRPADDGIHLRQFYIGREQRRAGLGRRALALLRDELWPPSAVVTVEVLSHNEGAIAFWRSVGFSPYSICLKQRPDAATGAIG